MSDFQVDMTGVRLKQLQDEILRRLAFRQLATCFLDSYNPKLHKSGVILNCILDYDGPFIANVPLRYQAHDFVQEAYEQIERNQLPHEESLDIFRWIAEWWKKDKGE